MPRAKIQDHIKNSTKKKLSSHQTPDYFVHESAEVSPDAEIGSNTKIWSLSQIREGVKIDANCNVGRNVYIDFDVPIGKNCKIQNNASIYNGATIEDGVFIGPHVILTNDKIPRAINIDGTPKSAEDWEAGKIHIKKGASIGARSVIVTNVTIGEFALIGSGSVVTKDIPPHALAYGNPARIHGYVCFCGHKLNQKLLCSNCNIKIEIKT